MVTNYPQEIVARAVAAARGEGQLVGGWSRVITRVRQFICGLHGHDPLLHFGQQRMSLQCVSCGFETPGWDLNERRPRVRFHGDPQRQRLAGPRLVPNQNRRIA